MGMLELLILSVGLSMDAFAAAVCKGLSIRRLRVWDAAVVGAYFGTFQALMPLLGYILGSAFAELAVNVDHWVAFALLSLIGGNMVQESFSSGEEDCGGSLSPREMLPLALATSIDALAVGVSFAFLQVEILPAISCIGTVTFFLSSLGVKLGHSVGVRYKAMAERVGGVVLILMGVKILAEHLTAG